MAATKYPKTCKHCGTPFQSEREAALYCSKQCADQGLRKEKVAKPCESCGEPFYPKNPTTRFCSPACVKAHRSTGQTKSCVVCGTAFYVPGDRPKSRFCSVACCNVWQGRNKVEYACIMCGKTVRVPASTKARKYCSIECRDADPAVQQQRILMNQKLQRGMRTKPERIGYQLLDDLEVPYIAQHLIAGKFCVDAFLPEHQTVVQFDGDYWHGNPAMFETLDARQEKRVRLDRSQDAYMAKLGYTVIRIWASELISEFPRVQQALRQRLSGIRRNVVKGDTIMPNSL